MLKLRIYNIIKDDQKGGAGKAFDIFMSALIVLNVVMIIADTFDGRPSSIVRISSVVEVVSIVIFTAEYALRIWTADMIRPELRPARARLKYITSGMALVDLLAILPFYIPFIIPVDLRVLRAIRLIRLVRLFKLNRYTSALASVGRVIKNKLPQLVSSMSVVLILMIISSILMYNIEHDAQPETFQNAFSAMWWSVATLTTVGYGDIYPVTIAGKIISAVIALLGIGLVAIPTGILSAGFVDELSQKKDREA
ncbi:MAG: ion transporter [Clostridiales Family XIII bacterium]|nr:ion transporter [Clostridiales Family XIII bacterium]